jgi:hypothetical protein
LHHVVLSTLGFVTMHVKHTWSSILTIVSSWGERSIPIFLIEQVGHTYKGAGLHYERSGILAGKI